MREPRFGMQSIGGSRFIFAFDWAKVRAVSRSTHKTTGKKGRHGKALWVRAR
jgi:hypothetical protein